MEPKAIISISFATAVILKCGYGCGWGIKMWKWNWDFVVWLLLGHVTVIFPSFEPIMNSECSLFEDKNKRKKVVENLLVFGKRHMTWSCVNPGRVFNLVNILPQLHLSALAKKKKDFIFQLYDMLFSFSINQSFT